MKKLILHVFLVFPAVYLISCVSAPGNRASVPVNADEIKKTAYVKPGIELSVIDREKADITVLKG